VKVVLQKFRTNLPLGEHNDVPVKNFEFLVGISIGELHVVLDLLNELVARLLGAVASLGI